MEAATWINAIASCIAATAGIITASSILLIWKQVKLLQAQITDDHERSRRDTAVKFGFEWATRIKQTSAQCRHFVDGLSFEQASDLFHQKPFKVPSEKKSMLVGCLVGVTDESALKEENGFIQLREKDVAHIRWQVITDLNLLETILSAWHHSIADKDIIMEEFHYLISREKGHTILKNFRDAAGGNDVFPSIAQFVKAIDKQRAEEEPPGKLPLAQFQK